MASSASCMASRGCNNHTKLSLPHIGPAQLPTLGRRIGKEGLVLLGQAQLVEEVDVHVAHYSHVLAAVLPHSVLAPVALSNGDASTYSLVMLKRP